MESGQERGQKMQRDEQHSYSNRDVVFSLRCRHIGWFVIFWAVLANVSCVLISLWKDFESSTGTHCGRKAPNYLPSISSAIGVNTPQRYIWRFCIGLDFGPRLLIAVMIQGYYKAVASPTLWRRDLYNVLAKISGILHGVENMGLVGLSFISSTENTFLHEASYVVFMVAAELHMLVTIVLYKWSRSGKVMTSEEVTSFRRKVLLFIMNLSVFLASVALYLRHNAYCEPGVYTMFAVLEYCCIATNICYHHTTMVLDMGHIEHKCILPSPRLSVSETNGVGTHHHTANGQHLNGWHGKDD